MVKKKNGIGASKNDVSISDDCLAEQITDEINSGLDDRIAYSLESDEAPCFVDYYVSTGSRLLDIIVSNTPNGGLPEGRLISIDGNESSGKSLLAQTCLKKTQDDGGVAVLIDTESSASKGFLKAINLDLSKIVYAQPGCIEDVFATIEKIVKFVKKNNETANRKKKITIVWDSVAATPTKAEVDGDYDSNKIGETARKISQGLKKIIEVISKEEITLVFINQLRHNISSFGYGEKWTNPGGKAIPFYSSVRIRLSSMGKIKKSTDEVIGMKVQAKVIKNKIAPPHRECDFEIYFDRGIVEGPSVFDMVKEHYGKSFQIKYKNEDATLSFSCPSKSTYLIEIKDAGGKILNDSKAVRRGDIDSHYLSDKDVSDSVNQVLLKLMVKKYRNEDIENVSLDSDDD